MCDMTSLMTFCRRFTVDSYVPTHQVPGMEEQTLNLSSYLTQPIYNQPNTDIIRSATVDKVSGPLDNYQRRMKGLTRKSNSSRTLRNNHLQRTPSHDLLSARHNTGGVPINRAYSEDFSRSSPAAISTPEQPLVTNSVSHNVSYSYHNRIYSLINSTIEYMCCVIWIKLMIVDNT